MTWPTDKAAPAAPPATPGIGRPETQRGRPAVFGLGLTLRSFPSMDELATYVADLEERLQDARRVLQDVADVANGYTQHRSRREQLECVHSVASDAVDRLR